MSILDIWEQEEINREKEQELEKNKENQNKILLKSLRVVVKGLKTLLKDERYKGYKYLLETRLKHLTDMRSVLNKTVKDNDEYLRLSLVYDAKIEELKNILEIPGKMENKLDNMLKNQGEIEE